MKRLFLLLFLLPVTLFAAELIPIGWGVVTVPSTTLYDKTGKVADELYGGDLFKVLREVKMNKAPAYYIEFKRKGEPVNGIISATDGRYFPGALPIEDSSQYAQFQADQKLCRAYYSACATRDSLVERKRKQYLEKSPAKQLEKLKKELANVPALDRKYAAEQKKAKTDAQRLKYQDLRKELRYNTVGLQEEIKRLEATAAAWLEKHPFDEEAVKKTAVWKRLNAQTETFKEQMDELDQRYPQATQAP